MANLKRYDYECVDWDRHEMVKCDDGEYVKFDDIKEYLPSASHNTSSPKELCPKCKSIYIWGSINGKKRWCDCGHKWSA